MTSKLFSPWYLPPQFRDLTYKQIQWDSGWPLKHQPSLASWLTVAIPRDRNSKWLPTLWSCDPVLTKQTRAEVGRRLLGKIFLLKRKAKRNGSACLWMWGVVNRKIQVWKFMEQKNGESLYLTIMAESLRSPIILLVSDLSLSSYAS